MGTRRLAVEDSLGIGLLLYNHLEADLKCFDLEIATAIAKDKAALPSSGQLAELVHSIRSYHAAELELQTLVSHAEQCRAWLVVAQLQLQSPALAGSPAAQQLHAVQLAAEDLNQRATAKSKEMAEWKEKVTKGFPEGSGRCSKELEDRIQALGVQRQAYYSGTLVGNHINKLCKVLYYFKKEAKYVNDELREGITHCICVEQYSKIMPMRSHQHIDALL